MNAVNLERKKKPARSSSLTTGNLLFRLLGLFIFDAGALWLGLNLLFDGYWPFAAIILVITILINVIWLRPEAYPLRWMSPGLAFMILISVYPILYTVYISFTNFGTGNLLPKVQAIEVLEKRTFLPEKGADYNTALYTNDAGEFALWLQPKDGAEGFLVLPGQQVVSVHVGAFDPDGFPEQLEGWERVSKRDMLKAISQLQDVEFGEPPHVVKLTGLNTAAEKKQRYVYDEEQDAIVDVATDTTYYADDITGAFIAEDGQNLIPGYTVGVGFKNYGRFISNPAFRGPLLLIFIWNVAFAFLSVLFAFSLGLLIAIAFGRDMPARKLIKSLLIIPFAIPGVLTILVWKGLWNPINGAVATTLAGWLGMSSLNVFADPIGVKVALLIVNVWLAYPYFMLITSGALQAIPQDMYEAADLDGAGAWAQFKNLTFPLLLVGVGPLLIASFIANFNTFNVIFLFNGGGPPMVGTPTPAGHSDILISYVYRLAFASAGQDFGYASAITVIIFFVLAAVTLYQYRYMKVWEEVGESV